MTSIHPTFTFYADTSPHATTELDQMTPNGYKKTKRIKNSRFMKEF